MGIFGSLKADWAKSKAAWKISQTKIAQLRSEKEAGRVGSGRNRSLNIVGESFKNSDGTSRQVEIKRCREGESVTLQPEPDNEYSENAIAVFSCRDIQIGYIGEEHCEWIARLIQNPDFKAEIEWITGGERGKPSRGVVLAISPC